MPDILTNADWMILEMLNRDYVLSYSLITGANAIFIRGDKTGYLNLNAVCATMKRGTIDRLKRLEMIEVCGSRYCRWYELSSIGRRVLNNSYTGERDYLYL